MRSWLARPAASIASLFDRGFDPARARRRPIVDGHGRSNVRGLYLAGEIAGTPLIKLGLNRGRAIIDHLATEGRGADVDEDLLDVLIVGAGCAGLGAADRCAQLGLRFLVIEQERPAQLIRSMTKGKPLLMEPPGEKNRTRLFCQECAKEELLRRWDEQIVELGLAEHIRSFERVLDVQRLADRDGFIVRTDQGEHRARRVVLAIGMAGNPRTLGVPGEREHAARISQNVADPDEFSAQDLVVFGAGDVACEAAIALADRGNHVSMVAPDAEFTFPKQRNIDAVRQRADDGRITLLLGHQAESIGPRSVWVKNLAGGERKELAADHVFRCIGADMPVEFFQRTGIRLEGSWHLGRWLLLLATFLVCHFIYGVKKDPPLWPWGITFDLFGTKQSIAGWLKNLHVGTGNWRFDLNGSFWYSLAYCLVMTWFGLKAYHRWGVRHHDPYQKKRFLSLIIVQWTLAFLIPMVLMWWVHGLAGDNPVLGRRGNFWHSSGFEYAFPLFFTQFVWDVGWLYFVYALVAVFIVIPLTTIWHGKRYCTWFCGCGGLAETLGDRWRHLAPKGRVASRWEWMNLAVLIWAVTAAVLVAVKIGFGYYITGEYYHHPDPATDGAVTAALFNGYDRIVDLWLVGIIPVALYPIFGGKIWCRYWCPLAKWMQLTSKWFGTLQISSNDKCITCGECSRYCEVGIDVMSFARSQQSFHNENTSCIQCGICITVCPMDVLSFNNDRPSLLTRRRATSADQARPSGEGPDAG